MSQTTQTTDDKYEDVHELREEFSELAEKKRQSLEDVHNDVSDNKRDSMAIRGWVENIQKQESEIGSDKVNVTVAYNADGEKQTKTFELDKPSSTEDFSVDNKFVRLVNIFGDRKNDPTGLLEREVWLKVTDGDNVELHIPKSMRTHTRIKESIHRKMVDTEISSWDDPVIPKNLLLGSVSAGFGVIGIMSILTFALATTALFTVQNLVMSAFLTVMLLLMIGFFVASTSEKTVERTALAIMGSSVIICILGILGFFSFNIPPQQGEFKTTVPNMIFMFGVVVTLISSVGHGYKPIKAVGSALKNSYGRLKRKFQSYRGIEYVEE